jgi:hypothetical protein
MVMDHNGNDRDVPHPHHQVDDANASKATLSQVNRLFHSPGSSSYGHNLPRDVPVMHHLSPESAGSSFEYIYLSIDERIHQEPLLTFFDNVEWAFHVLPCPDFEVFIWSNFIGAHDTLFVSDLPPPILPAGHCLLNGNLHLTSPCFRLL